MSVSRAHLNPTITLSALPRGGLRGHEALAYLTIQAADVTLDMAAVHATFDMPAQATDTHTVTGPTP